MEKKPYEEPRMTVIQLHPTSLIAASPSEYPGGPFGHIPGMNPAGNTENLA